MAGRAEHLRPTHARRQSTRTTTGRALIVPPVGNEALLASSNSALIEVVHCHWLQRGREPGPRRWPLISWGRPDRLERRSGCSAAPQRSDRVEQILDPQTELGIAFERQFALEEQPVRVVTTAHQTP